MGPRSWLNLSVVIALVLLCSCSSPGKQFAYKDLKVSFGPSATPAQPVVGQSTTLNFTLRNTWNQPITGVAWELRETTSGSTVLTPPSTVDFLAFGSSAQSFVISSPTKGTHTYEVAIDTANIIAEQDETNNTSATLTVLVADQDIAFGTPAPAVTWPTTPNTTDQPTLTFYINDTVNAAQLAPGTVSVPYAITVSDTPDGTPVTVTPVTATPASPVTVDPAGTLPVQVQVTLPAVPSAGTYYYTITLSPADGDDSNTTNNTATVTVVVPASI